MYSSGVISPLASLSFRISSALSFVDGFGGVAPGVFACDIL